ncbi:MAG: glycosyltransferase family 2 protein [Candidatus Rokubacteria bacterium]|nr:glycosyltransferase family 2 protein [Candidatus Rokubacteria bacterium]
MSHTPPPPPPEAGSRGEAPAVAELCIVIPSFNERDNVAPLVERIDRVLDGVRWEVIYVDDDSPDGTADLVREIARRDPRVRCIQRLGRRGLASAVVEGVLSSSAPMVAVMDADLQHDEALLPRMLEVLATGDIDVVIGSRYLAGGDSGGLGRGRRVWFSRLGTALSRLISQADLSDPMSGFFMMRRSAFDLAVRRLSGQGFKILLDLFASTPQPYRFRELPYAFRSRLHGESKLDSLVGWEYILLILDKLVRGVAPVRFAMFVLVGGSGVLVHVAMLWLGLRALDLGFPVAQTVATLAAMSSNFALNNLLTYRDRRLTGLPFVRGLLSFYVICSAGLVANVGVAAVLFERAYQWWVAGAMGALMSAVWNYAVSSVFTWRARS